MRLTFGRTIFAALVTLLWITPSWAFNPVEALLLEEISKKIDRKPVGINAPITVEKEPKHQEVTQEKKILAANSWVDMLEDINKELFKIEKELGESPSKELVTTIVPVETVPAVETADSSSSGLTGGSIAPAATEPLVAEPLVAEPTIMLASVELPKPIETPQEPKQFEITKEHEKWESAATPYQGNQVSFIGLDSTYSDFSNTNPVNLVTNKIPLKEGRELETKLSSAEAKVEALQKDSVQKDQAIKNLLNLYRENLNVPPAEVAPIGSPDQLQARSGDRIPASQEPWREEMTIDHMGTKINDPIFRENHLEAVYGVNGMVDIMDQKLTQTIKYDRPDPIRYEQIVKTWTYLPNPDQGLAEEGRQVEQRLVNSNQEVQAEVDIRTVQAVESANHISQFLDSKNYSQEMVTEFRELENRLKATQDLLDMLGTVREGLVARVLDDKQKLSDNDQLLALMAIMIAHSQGELDLNREQKDQIVAQIEVFEGRIKTQEELAKEQKQCEGEQLTSGNIDLFKKLFADSSTIFKVFKDGNRAEFKLFATLSPRLDEIGLSLADIRQKLTDAKPATAEEEARLAECQGSLDASGACLAELKKKVRDSADTPANSTNLNRERSEFDF